MSRPRKPRRGERRTSHERHPVRRVFRRAVRGPARVHQHGAVRDGRGPGGRPLHGHGGAAVPLQRHQFLPAHGGALLHPGGRAPGRKRAHYLPDEVRQRPRRPHPRGPRPRERADEHALRGRQRLGAGGRGRPGRHRDEHDAQGRLRRGLRGCAERRDRHDRTHHPAQHPDGDLRHLRQPRDRGRPLPRRGRAGGAAGPRPFGREPLHLDQARLPLPQPAPDPARAGREFLASHPRPDAALHHHVRDPGRDLHPHRGGGRGRGLCAVHRALRHPRPQVGGRPAGLHPLPGS